MRHFRITDRLTKKTILITAAVSLAVGIGVGVSITQFLFSGEEGSPIPFIKPRSAPRTSVTQLTVEALKNTTYHLSDFIKEPIAFSGGRAYIESAIPNIAEPRLEASVGTIAFGDLNGDGAEDAVVEIRARTGGTGVFPYLVAVLNRAGQSQQAAVLPLADREQVNAIAIRNGIVTVNLLTHGPNEGLCCPTQQEVNDYRLSGTMFAKVISDFE